MSEKLFAVRNIRLCTKDCLCLYVCPTHATDTENSIIDVNKCTGCGACANACPSHAISLVPYDFPKQKELDKNVNNILNDCIKAKTNEIALADKLSVESKLFKAISMSLSLQAEDLVRENGFMLPQADEVIELLKELKDSKVYQNINKNTIIELINKLNKGETKMPELKGTKTEKNLMDAFAGESQARNKYTYFASVAKKEGYEQIAEMFLETAENEKEHAKLWFKHLNGIGTTAENLKAAAAGENFEYTDMYKRMAEEAREEGFPLIAAQFEMVGKIEKSHEERYLKLLENIEMQKVFAKGEIVMWKCRNCGHLVLAQKAPLVCPVCAHPQSFFEVKASNY